MTSNCHDSGIGSAALGKLSDGAMAQWGFECYGIFHQLRPAKACRKPLQLASITVKSRCVVIGLAVHLSRDSHGRKKRQNYDGCRLKAGGNVPLHRNPAVLVGPLHSGQGTCTHGAIGIVDVSRKRNLILRGSQRTVGRLIRGSRLYKNADRKRRWHTPAAASSKARNCREYPSKGGDNFQGRYPPPLLGEEYIPQSTLCLGDC